MCGDLVWPCVVTSVPVVSSASRETGPVASKSDGETGDASFHQQLEQQRPILGAQAESLYLRGKGHGQPRYSSSPLWCSETVQDCRLRDCCLRTQDPGPWPTHHTAFMLHGRDTLTAWAQALMTVPSATSPCPPDQTLQHERVCATTKPLSTRG